MVNEKLSKIMYIEDDEDIRTIAEIALMMGDFSITLCASGKEGIEAAQTHQPDLILLDVMMPGMDGIATLAALRQNPLTKTIPVVFLTARTQPTEVAHFKSLGAIDVIIKPFDPMTLAFVVKDIYEKYMSQKVKGV